MNNNDRLSGMSYNDKYFGISKRIAKWKEPSEFEAMMADAAESDPKAKFLYASYYKHLDSEYYEKGKLFARDLFESHSIEFKDLDFESVYADMVYCLHRYGFSFQDYCIYNLIDKSEHCRKQFVTDKLRYYYCDILNSPEIEGLMTNKLSCYKEYQKFFKREMSPVITMSDKNRFMEFVARNNRFIYKPLNDHSGHGIQLVDINDIDSNDWFDSIIRNSPGVVEELIKQGDKMNRINHSSINSCRIVTFTIGNDVKIIGGALRMGVGNAVTDNAGSGGIYASIDAETGIIQSDAKNYLNQHFKFHPTSNICILGFELPQWNEAVNLIREMATYRKGTTLISWDIAYSDKGWCMVEANDNGDWSLLQSNFCIGKKKELYNLMDKYFSLQYN